MKILIILLNVKFVEKHEEGDVKVKDHVHVTGKSKSHSK